MMLSQIANDRDAAAMVIPQKSPSPFGRPVPLLCSFLKAGMRVNFVRLLFIVACLGSLEAAHNSRTIISRGWDSQAPVSRRLRHWLRLGDSLRHTPPFHLCINMQPSHIALSLLLNALHIKMSHRCVARLGESNRGATGLKG
jgi:hypothetical protein